MLVSTLALVAITLTPPPLAIGIGKARTLQGLRVTAVAGAPSGSKFAACLENGEVRIIEAKSGATIRKFKTPQPSYAVAWNPKGTLVVTGDESARIIVWNAANGQKVKEVRPHSRGIQSLVFNTDGSRVLSTGKDDVVKQINISTGKTEKTVPGKGANLYSAVWIPGGYAVGTLGFSPQIRKGPAVLRLKGHSDDSAFDLDYNAKTSRLLTSGRDGKSIVWSLAGAKLKVLGGHADWVVHGRFSPNGKYVATGSSDRTVKVYNVGTGKCEATIQNESYVGAPVAFTGDGKYLITASSDEFIQIWPLTPAQG